MLVVQVRGAHRHVSRELPLDCHVCVVRARRRQIRIGRRDRLRRKPAVRNRRGARPDNVAPSGGRRRVRQGSRREAEVPTPEAGRCVCAGERDRFHRHTVELRQVTHDGAEHHVVVNAIATSDNQLGIAIGVVRHANSWSEVVHRLMELVWVRVQHVDDLGHRLHLPAQTGIHCQIAGRLERVLNEQAGAPPLTRAPGRAEALHEVHRVAVEERRQAGEGEHASQASERPGRRPGQRGLDAHRVDVRADLDLVPAPLHGVVVDDLVTRLRAALRVAQGSAEVADAGDGEPRTDVVEQLPSVCVRLVLKAKVVQRASRNDVRIRPDNRVRVVHEGCNRARAVVEPAGAGPALHAVAIVEIAPEEGDVGRRLPVDLLDQDVTTLPDRQITGAANLVEAELDPARKVGSQVRDEIVAAGQDVVDDRRAGRADRDGLDLVYPELFVRGEEEQLVAAERAADAAARLLLPEVRPEARRVIRIRVGEEVVRRKRAVTNEVEASAADLVRPRFQNRVHDAAARPACTPR